MMNDDVWLSTNSQYQQLELSEARAAEQPLPQQPVRRALCSFHHTISHDPEPLFTSPPAMLGKTTFRTSPLALVSMMITVEAFNF